MTVATCPHCPGARDAYHFDERAFATQVATFLEALAERHGYAPDVQPLQLLPTDPERLAAGRRYAHEQLGRHGWLPLWIDALVDAVYALRAEKDAADDQALQAYREVHQLRQPTEDQLAEVNAEARNVKLDVHRLLEDLIEQAEDRVAAAIDAGLTTVESRLAAEDADEARIELRHTEEA